MGSGSSRRRDLVDAARKRWAAELVDLSSRNNLLSYRDLTAGTLSLDSVDPAVVFRLLAGRKLKLSQVFMGDEARTDAVRRARTIHGKAKVAKEERGIQTLHLAVGLATWRVDGGGTPPNAPFLLVPLELAPEGGSQSDFTLKVNGELEINPVLIQKLKSDFDLALDPADLRVASGIVDAIDTPEELDAALGWLNKTCGRVADFDLTGRVVVGNFSYAKLPMVRDLEESLDAMVVNDLIAALAGDTEAQKTIRAVGSDVEISGPDDTPSADEFLVLDADSSQNYAINAVLAGRNLIVRGPPGTGKSQTIANLISTLIARGRKVLFVAEKRAAIDAVVGRLEDVGLVDLVMDLHATGQSKKATFESIAAVMQKNRQLTRPALGQLHHRLDDNKRHLIEHNEALHNRREPWGISFYEAHCDLIALGESGQTEVRLERATINALGEADHRRLQIELRQLAELSGLSLASTGSPWSASPIIDDAGVDRARGEVESAIRSLVELRERMAAACSASGFSPQTQRSGWVADLALWTRLDNALANWKKDAFGLPVDELIATVDELAGSAFTRAWASVSDGEYRSAKKRLREALASEIELSGPTLYQSAVELAESKSLLFERSGGQVPSPPADLEALAGDHTLFVQGVAALEGLCGSSAPDDLDALAEWLKRLRADSTTLARLPVIATLRRSLTQSGYGELLAELAARPHDPDEAVAAMRRAFLITLVDQIEFDDVRISGFDSAAHSRLNEQFVSDDHEHISSTAERVRRVCAEQAVESQNTHAEGAAVVTAEANKKRPRKSPREVFEAAPEVMLGLKPCWAMSPLIVSQVLPSDRQYFDVVVFDEGSQVRPADSIPAIMRAKQLVVAGDERQLPPTDFFATSGGVDDDDPSAPVLTMDGSFESILDALVAFVEPRTLAWHYRSRDERLIAFSNAYVYDGSLTTFPGVLTEGSVGLELVRQSPADPNAGQSGEAEVRSVVELILEHAESTPERSLGVIAMGIKHADRIEAALRKTLAERGEMEFFDESRDEPFFVKNLERVQGDERDSIILSVGYGKNQDGKLVYRFGPINNAGGERRLNVAITRAKRKMTLVSSFSHAEMDPAKCKSRGVELLREYLAYCESGGERIGQTIEPGPELNPFEIDVRDALQAAGIRLTPQHGCSGYRIDFAAHHPDEPGRMVLAIECDGASYHSSKSARDRDRLRQEHLERLGWRFHRIWSQDWFRDSEREVSRTKLAFDRAVLSRNPPATEPAEEEFVAQGPVVSTPTRSQKPPFATRRSSIDAYSDEELIQIVNWVASDGLLRTDEAWAGEVRAVLGFKRNGTKIAKRLGVAVEAASGGLLESL